MSEMAFVLKEGLIDGNVLCTGPLEEGDWTTELNVTGSTTVAVQVFGVLKGGVVKVLGSIVDGEYALLMNRSGEGMEYLKIPRIDLIGVPIQSLKVVVEGGFENRVYVGVYMVKGRR